MTTETPDTSTSTTGTTGTTGSTATDTSTTDQPTTDTPTSTTAEATGSTGGTGSTGNTTGNVCDGITVPPIDEGMCQILADDYEPRVNNSANDMWPKCISDMGPYTLVDKTPGSIARIVAYENIADLLWRKQDPTKDDFTAARDEYVIPEGIESRVVRREDLHYPAIPMAEWDPQVDPDKQCTVAALAMKYPERCIGPSKMQPLLDAEFAAGQTADGDPNVHAERIHAGILWWIYLSTYKEANTCATVAAKDCDSMWAYYTGGETIDMGIGMSSEVKALSTNTHERIHDGLMAVRCWRDTAQMNMMYPLLDAVDANSKMLFARGWEQLDQSLHRGFAVVVRDYMQKYIDASCNAGDTAKFWAFLEVAGPVLQREADERDAANAQSLADLWAKDAPGPDEVAAAITALDAVFPCP